MTGSVLQQRRVLESLAIPSAIAQVDFGIYLPVAYLSLVVVIRRALDASGLCFAEMVLDGICSCPRHERRSVRAHWLFAGQTAHEFSFRKRPLIVTIR